MLFYTGEFDSVTAMLYSCWVVGFDLALNLPKLTLTKRRHTTGGIPDLLTNTYCVVFVPCLEFSCSK